MDRDELAGLWTAFYAPLLCYIRRAFPSLREDAEDLVQESFARAFRSLRLGGPLRGAAPWLYTAARNLCVDRLRSRRRHPQAELPQDIASPGLPESERLERDALAVAVSSALDSLEGRDREICFLYYYEEFSVRDIARIAGRAEGTIKYRLFRIRKLLGRRLEGLW